MHTPLRPLQSSFLLLPDQLAIKSWLGDFIVLSVVSLGSGNCSVSFDLDTVR